MARSSVSRLAQVACRSLRTASIARTALPRISAAPVFLSAPSNTQAPAARRFISSSSDLRGITPDGKPPKDVETPQVTRTAASITDAEYHALADAYMDKLLTRLEELQDEREDVDVEFSSGVLTLSLGPDVGTYVINKQPPNKQIWLSSPKTGPKRYDYVILGEGQHEKQDTATGDWVYLRDGTTLSDLLTEEVGVDLSLSDAELGS
ncbi:73ec47b7-2e43-4c1e-9637-1f147b3ba1c3 [Thermothielavioides terrestris]|uniref:ferroxidase n=1 Tax=Thermothielavioides terrestris TaxID=2587410 RepID=A0A3S4BRE7_9PEZI|nr:73ec47b7-2e43-4c1e-9637-1f147b3ba1c3 [Thermothielavioides terrestris]